MLGYLTKFEERKAHGQAQGLGDRRRADSILASACLPYMFQAVEVDGERTLAADKNSLIAQPALRSTSKSILAFSTSRTALWFRGLNW
jgi:hypothetical protein